MKWFPIEQNTTEWLYLRAGKPTASEFGKILTPGGKLSESADKYMAVKLYEWMTGLPLLDKEPTKWMDRGKELEPQSIKGYEFQTGNEVQPGGFFTTDNELIGASPDGRIHTDGVLESKAYAPAGHVLHMMIGFADKEHKPQTQGQLWVAERDYADLTSFCPELPQVIVRKGRDEAYIKLLADALDQFCESMLRRREELNQKFGPFPLPKPQPIENPHFITDADVEDYMEIVRTRS